MLDTLRLNFACCDVWKPIFRGLNNLYFPFDDLRQLDDSVGNACLADLQSRSQRVLVKTHMGSRDFSRIVNDGPEWAKKLNEHYVVHVTRDPRAVLASQYVFEGSNKSFNQWLKTPRRSGRRLPGAAYAVFNERWRQVADISVDYQALVRDPGHTLEKIMNCCGLTRTNRPFKLPPKLSRLGVRLNRFRWRPGSSAIVSKINPGWQQLADEESEAILVSQLNS